MIFLNTRRQNKNIFFKTKLIYSIKLCNDFIFFINLIKEYIKLRTIDLLPSLKNFIYFLNILSIKYILYTLYYKVFFIKNYFFYQIYNLELFYWNSNNFIKYFNKKYNIEQKILLIKKVSRTRAKGRIKRYKVILLIGNKSGWFGIGYSKNYYLQEAISNARIHAFKNIYQIPLFYSNLLKNHILVKQKTKKLYLFSSKYKIQPPTNYVIRVLVNFIGITNVTSKFIKIHNIYNTLSLILKI